MHVNSDVRMYSRAGSTSKIDDRGAVASFVTLNARNDKPTAQTTMPDRAEGKLRKAMQSHLGRTHIFAL